MKKLQKEDKKLDELEKYTDNPSNSIRPLSQYGIFFSICLIILTIIQTTQVQFNPTKAFEPDTDPLAVIQPPTPIPTPLPEDKRVTKLRAYLTKKKSILAQHAEYIVQVSDDNGIGWTEIVAISNKESELCKHIRKDSHNCWGWGGSNRMYFKSYEEGIAFTAKTLNEKYRANANRGIQQKYCPTSDNCASNWVSTVTATSHEILGK
jgi:hypothetical protein